MSTIVLKLDPFELSKTIPLTGNVEYCKAQKAFDEAQRFWATVSPEVTPVSQSIKAHLQLCMALVFHAHSIALIMHLDAGMQSIFADQVKKLTEELPSNLDSLNQKT